MSDYEYFFDHVLGIHAPHNEAAVAALDPSLFHPDNPDDPQEQDFCNLLAETFKAYVHDELGLNWTKPPHHPQPHRN